MCTQERETLFFENLEDDKISKGSNDFFVQVNRFDWIFMCA